MDIANIKQKCIDGELLYTLHVSLRMQQRQISEQDIVTAILNGEIIEEYADDSPYPSCLIFGYTINDRVLHVVCGVAPEELYLITAYYPDSVTWFDDLKTRRNKEA